MKKSVLKVHPKDNVIVALSTLEKGSTIEFEGKTYFIQEAIQPKHKFYEEDMNPGDSVYMYGVLVGKIQVPVKGG